MKIHLGLIAMMFLSASAEKEANASGAETRNGGNAVVCYANAQKTAIRSVRLFDYWEMQQQRPDLGSIVTDPRKSVADFIIEITNRVRSFDPVKAEQYRGDALSIENEIDSFLVSTLTPVDDDRSQITPSAPCYKEQFAVQVRYPLPGSRRFAVNKSLYQNVVTTNSDRAGIILHEVIYRDLIKNEGHTTSDGTRLLNYAYATPYLSSASIGKISKLMLDARVKYAGPSEFYISELNATLVGDKIVTDSNSQIVITRETEINTASIRGKVQPGDRLTFTGGALDTLCTRNKRKLEVKTQAGWSLVSDCYSPSLGRDWFSVGWSKGIITDFHAQRAVELKYALGSLSCGGFVSLGSQGEIKACSLFAGEDYDIVTPDRTFSFTSNSQTQEGVYVALSDDRKFIEEISGRESSFDFPPVRIAGSKRDVEIKYVKLNAQGEAVEFVPLANTKFPLQNGTLSVDTLYIAGTKFRQVGPGIFSAVDNGGYLSLRIDLAEPVRHSGERVIARTDQMADICKSLGWRDTLHAGITYNNELIKGTEHFFDLGSERIVVDDRVNILKSIRCFLGKITFHID